MSTGWTAEKLDALPAHTLVTWGGVDTAWFLFDGQHWERMATGQSVTSAELLDGSRGSLRVVSVPIDALLADETCNAGADVLSPTGEWWAQSQARYVLRAAVEHVTGEAT